MIGKIVSFIGGVYAGVLIDQTYQLPKISDPAALWEQIKKYFDEKKKEKKD